MSDLTKFTAPLVELHSIDQSSNDLIGESGADVIGVGDGICPSGVLGYALDRNIRQIVQKSGLAPEAEIQLSALMINDQGAFLNHPLSSILKSQKVGSDEEKRLTGFEFHFTSASQKAELFRRFEAYLESVTKSQAFFPDAMLIADELFTNAVFNAPYVDSSSLGMVGRRNENLLGKQLRPGRVFAGVDDVRMIIGCEDQYGSLDPEVLLDRVRKCIELGAGPMMNLSEDRGAGIGTFMIYSASASYYVGVEREKKTVICASLALRGGYKRRSGAPKNLHFFEK